MSAALCPVEDVLLQSICSHMSAATLAPPSVHGCQLNSDEKSYSVSAGRFCESTAAGSNRRKTDSFGVQPARIAVCGISWSIPAQGTDYDTSLREQHERD
ncbi:hypothetical protein MRX96_024845 [Rhipicephalus microplus]